MATYPEPSHVHLRVIPSGDILSLAAHRSWTTKRQWPAVEATRVTVTLTAGRLLPNDAWIHALILTSPPIADVQGRTVLVTGAWRESATRFWTHLAHALTPDLAHALKPGLSATLDRWDAEWRAFARGMAHA